MAKVSNNALSVCRNCSAAQQRNKSVEYDAGDTNMLLILVQAKSECTPSMTAGDAHQCTDWWCKDPHRQKSLLHPWGLAHPQPHF